MHQKFLALLIAVVMLFGVTVSAASPNTADDPVRVGSLSRVTGEFATDLWSTNTVDLDIRELLHGAGTIAWTKGSGYEVNSSVVERIVTSLSPEGEHEYTFILKNGLKYSDGSRLTAGDYVFSVLLQSMPAIRELGGHTNTYSMLKGFEEYSSGESHIFSGVRLIDERTFTLILKADAVPAFYELSYVNVMPYPASVIAPGCRVADEGIGAVLYGICNAQTLASTLRGETGYCAAPGVTTGPYRLVSYDAATGTVTLEANPYYAGNFEGVQPTIKNLQFVNVTGEEAAAMLASGELDILNKVTSASTAEACAQAAAAVTYPRSGMGYLALACEDPVMSSSNVRQAIAYCTDSAALAADYLGTTGEAVYGYYGLGQWMVKEYKGDLKSDLPNYAFDPSSAAALLDADGWTVGADGTRSKLIDGQMVPLQIRFAKTAGNAAAQWIEDNTVAVLQQIGFQVVVTELPYTDVLAQLYRTADRTCNMMFVATNFSVLFDPYYTFHTDDAYQGVQNQSGLRDEELMLLAQAMRSCDPNDHESYITLWKSFQQRYAEILPGIPLYSNSYTDYVSDRISGYDPAAFWSWTGAILYTTAD